MPAECPNEGVNNSLDVTLKTEPSGNTYGFEAQSHSQLLEMESWKVGKPQPGSSHGSMLPISYFSHPVVDIS